MLLITPVPSDPKNAVWCLRHLLSGTALIQANNCAISTPNALAMRTITKREGLRFPRSIPPR